VIPGVAALGQERIDLAPNNVDRWLGGRRCAIRTRRETSPGCVVHSTEHGLCENRRRAHLEAPRLALVVWPVRLERTAPSRRPPTAPQRGRRDDRDHCGAANLQSNLDPPVRIAATEERGAVDRVEDPDPLGIPKATKFLAEERVVGPCRRQRFPKQSLDCM